ncbi:MAG: CotH kinase family protein [Ignavibacteria bacterium]|nr:CotH kinase family protein [Ignavibacteria bacterium]
MKIAVLIFMGFFLGSLNAQVNLTSSNLPIVIINTKGQTIKDEPKINVEFGIIYNGESKRNSITDSINHYKGIAGIEIRGHSSQGFPKKQYGIELRDALGNNVNVPLLGMPAESDWVLNASYTDKSLLRNVIAYKLGNDLGRYASRTRFCEVILNNQYLGIYILQEKVKRDKNRVDIKKLETPDISGDALTGGYILKIDRIDPGDKYFNSLFSGIYPRTPSRPSPISYVHVYPNSANILPVQQNYINNFINLFETLLSKSAINEPFSGYSNYIDVNAWVDYFLISEFTKATDAYRLSTYLYKNRDSEGGKLVLGPIWDYDLAFGLADYADGWLASGWQAYLNHYEGVWSAPFWTTKLIDDPMFLHKLAKRWHAIKETVFKPEIVVKFIDENTSFIHEAQLRNFQKWPELFNGSYIWPNKNRFYSYNDEILYLKTWITQRYNWINNKLPQNYSDVEWLTPDLSKIKFELNKTVKIPLSQFAVNVKNVTSLEFVSQSNLLHVSLVNDSVSFTMYAAGIHIFKGVAKLNGVNVSISPEYKTEVITSVVGEKELPAEFELYQNYPNPFNPETTISYVIPSVRNLKDFSSIISPRNDNIHFTLKVYDLLGREVTTLVNETQRPGIYNVKFSMNDIESSQTHHSLLNTHHSQLSSAIYFYTLKTGSYSQTKKMVLVR